MVGTFQTFHSASKNSIGVSPSGKAAGFDPAIPRFESWHPSHILDGELDVEFDPGDMPRFKSSTPAIFLGGSPSLGVMME